jgi:protein-tyrosine phosphatase
VNQKSGAFSPLVSPTDASSIVRTVLFICSGNYYRSRVAEVLFNSMAAKTRLNWKADSRGTALDRGTHNVGPISPQALDWLRAQDIEVDRDIRFPIQLQEEDITHADRVIALDETEHRPYLETRFPIWADRVEYWNIPDLGLMSADVALPAIDRAVRELLLRLSGDDHG